MTTDARRPVFYDPHQRRWRWVRRLGFALAAVASLTLLGLVGMVLVNPALPSLGLPADDRLPQPHHLVPPKPERPLRAADKLDPAGVAFFESKVRPVLIEHCYGCHSAEASATGRPLAFAAA